MTSAEHHSFIVHRLKALGLARVDPNTGELQSDLQTIADRTRISPMTLRHWIFLGDNLEGHAAFIRFYEFLGVHWRACALKPTRIPK